MAYVADVPRNRRRPKFTVDELEVLVDQMQRNKSTLLGKLSDVHAAQTKNDAWRAIAAMISAISNVGRPPMKSGVNGRTGQASSNRRSCFARRR